MISAILLIVALALFFAAVLVPGNPRLIAAGLAAWVASILLAGR